MRDFGSSRFNYDVASFLPLEHWCLRAPVPFLSSPSPRDTHTRPFFQTHAPTIMFSAKVLASAIAMLTTVGSLFSARFFGRWEPCVSLPASAAPHARDAHDPAALRAAGSSVAALRALRSFRPLLGGGGCCALRCPQACGAAPPSTRCCDDDCH